MDSRKQTARGIDGIYAKPSKRQPIFKANTLDSIRRPEVRRPEARQSQPRKRAPTNAFPQQNKSSLIGMTLPNNSYAKPNVNKKPKKSRFKRPWSRKRKVVTSILTVVVILLGVTGWFGSRILGSLDKVFHGNIFSDAEALFSQTTLKGESSGRINILVAGNSADDPGHDGADLTDSIMLLSIDTKNHTGFMLSIPRDLWVYIPGLDSYDKINATADVTNFSQQGYPNGGMGQLEQVVQTDLGIPVDYYALVNYAAFKDSVNAVGGITVDINSPDPRGLYDSFTNLKLPNGEDKLNGQEALNLSRARGDDVAGDISYGFPNSDFTRTMYQREMVVAILKKATSAGVIANPLKVTSLFSSLSNNVQTDLSLQDVLTLDSLTKGINLSKLGSDTYSSSVDGNTKPLLIGYVDPRSGQDALIPSLGVNDFAGLKAYYQQLIGHPATVGSSTASDTSATGSSTASDTASNTAN
jgi:LCP family protein required for cell wall assembly